MMADKSRGGMDELSAEILRVLDDEEVVGVQIFREDSGILRLMGLMHSTAEDENMPEDPFVNDNDLMQEVDAEWVKATTQLLHAFLDESLDHENLAPTLYHTYVEALQQWAVEHGLWDEFTELLTEKGFLNADGFPVGM